VNDLVDQVKRGQVSDPKARLMFAEKVNELNAAAYRQKEYEEEKVRRDWQDAADSLNRRDANGCLVLDAACRAGTNQRNNPQPTKRVCDTRLIGNSYQTICKDVPY
jgi:ABC-type antimicrobial peptide transport system ATPase subunit